MVEEKADRRTGGGMPVKEVKSSEAKGAPMGVPKRRTSKSKIRARHASHRIRVVASRACPQCGAPQQPHRVCRACGYYRGRQVITVEVE